MTNAFAPDPELSIEMLREMERCAGCGKTRAVIIISSPRRGWHQPERPEYVSPQTHCVCADGPVEQLEQYQVVFRRYGNVGKITVRTPAMKDEPLLVREATRLLHPEHGLNFGKRDRGSANAALLVLELLVTRERAVRLHARFMDEIMVPLGYNGGQLSFAQLRTWIAAQEAPARAGQGTESVLGSLNDFVNACFDGHIEGLTVSRDSAGDAERDIIDFIEGRLKRGVSYSDGIRLSIAIATAWRARMPATVEG
jgi:hypothetical protein